MVSSGFLRGKIKKKEKIRTGKAKQPQPSRTAVMDMFRMTPTTILHERNLVDVKGVMLVDDRRCCWDGGQSVGSAGRLGR